jgi:hypothetical protein
LGEEEIVTLSLREALRIYPDLRIEPDFYVPEFVDLFEDIRKQEQAEH